MISSEHLRKSVIILRSVILVVLTAAVVFNVYVDWDLSRPFNFHPETLFAFGIEVVIILSLISGRYARRVWLFTCVCFAVFAAVALHRAIAGKNSCGCFGKIIINPWLTAGFDFSVVIAIIVVLHAHLKTWCARIVPSAVAITTTLAVTMSIFGGVTWRRQATGSPISDVQIAKDQSLVVLETKAWIGKNFPLVGFIDLGMNLSKGRWLVILYHSDCTECQKAVPRYEHLADRLRLNGVDQSIALIEMPPYTEGADQLVSKHSSAFVGRLDASHEWFATTPVVLELTNGRVDAAYEGDAAVEASKSIAP